MSLTAESTVRDLAVETPGATRVFEKLGIDYCCGGLKSLTEACRAANLPVADVLRTLAEAESQETIQPVSKPESAPLSELIAHILHTHHQFTRTETARLAALFEKVCSVHGSRHPEVLEMRDTFSGLSQELAMHLMKEERILFPYIERLEEAAIEKRPAMPAPFGTVQNPVSMMMQEHDSAGNALRSLRLASDNYTPPADACVTFQTLYQALEGLEKDLHQHIHLENNVLFPRALELENQTRH